jgi:hypothetical protein
MKNLVNLLFLGLILLLVFSSCKAYRNVENLKPKTVKELKTGPFDKASLSKLVPGEKIIVTTLSRFEYRMTFSNLDGDNLVGSVQKVNKSKVIGEEVLKIPIHEIESLYAKRKSAAATILVVVPPVAVAAYFVLIVLAFVI